MGAKWDKYYDTSLVTLPDYGSVFFYAKPPVLSASSPTPYINIHPDTNNILFPKSS